MLAGGIDETADTFLPTGRSRCPNLNRCRHRS